SCAYAAAAESISTPNNNIVFFILRYSLFGSSRPYPSEKPSENEHSGARMGSRPRPKSNLAIAPNIVPAARPRGEDTGEKQLAGHDVALERRAGRCDGSRKNVARRRKAGVHRHPGLFLNRNLQEDYCCGGAPPPALPPPPMPPRPRPCGIASNLVCCSGVRSARICLFSSSRIARILVIMSGSCAVRISSIFFWSAS